MSDLLSPEAARHVLYRILAMHPNAKSELHYDSPFHLLMAVILSAQTTDKQVNKITPRLFSRYPNPKSLAETNVSELETFISSIGLYHNKANNLKKMGQQLHHDYNDEVPNNKQALLSLAGVGEKTANVVLAEIWQIPAIAVDTHVSRIAKVFKIVPENANPMEVEQRLEELLPTKDWIKMHHAMIMFGRYTMPARLHAKDPYMFLK